MGFLQGLPDEPLPEGQEVGQVATGLRVDLDGPRLPPIPTLPTQVDDLPVEGVDPEPQHLQK